MNTRYQFGAKHSLRCSPALIFYIDIESAHLPGLSFICKARRDRGLELGGSTRFRRTPYKEVPTVDTSPALYLFLSLMRDYPELQVAALRALAPPAQLPSPQASPLPTQRPTPSP